MRYIPLFEVQRARTVESIHFGAVAVADAEGRLVASAGDPHTVTYMRSSAKPSVLNNRQLSVGGGHVAFRLTYGEDRGCRSS